MGQYFRIVNLDTREWFSPDDFDETIKDPHLAMKTMEALGSLLMTSGLPAGGFTYDGEVYEALPSGRWCGNRVAIIGDYSRDRFLVDGCEMIGSSIYEEVDDEPEKWPNIAAEIGGRDSRCDDGWDPIAKKWSDER